MANFPLRVSPDRRHLVDADGAPFFLVGDTPWFLQKLKLDDVRHVLDDRKRRGFNTLLLELLDDSHIPSIDGNGDAAFATDTDLTRPNEPYWRYAETVLDEATRRGFFLIVNSLWFGYGGGLWMHHATVENCRAYGKFVARRFARFPNLMWVHVADRIPDPHLLACARELARAVDRAAPHQLQTAHLRPEYASATYLNDEKWLDVNLGYTYDIAYRHILPEYWRDRPVRPIFLAETGYEGEPNDIELLPDANKGDLWTPRRIRRNAWWAVLSGACGYCAGTRLWRWEKDWKATLDARSIREAPLLKALLEPLPWHRLIPDHKHAFVTAGYGQWEQADYVAAARTDDGRLGIAYLPDNKPVTVAGSWRRARWFDPTSGAFRDAGRGPNFTPPTVNAAGEPDGVLVLENP